MASRSKRTQGQPNRVSGPGLYCRRSISALSELRRGDHIRVDRGVYHHHMMVVNVVNQSEVTVIHYTGIEQLEEEAVDTAAGIAEGGKVTPKSAASSFSSFSFSTGGQTVGEIKEESLEVRPSEIQVLDYRDQSLVVYSVDESMTRARSRLGEKRYSVVTNNCEHLVNWAITGTAQSAQTQAGGRAALDGVEAGWQAGRDNGSVGWGLLVGLASAASSYLQARDSTHDQ